MRANMLLRWATIDTFAPCRLEPGKRERPLCPKISALVGHRPNRLWTICQAASGESKRQNNMAVKIQTLYRQYAAKQLWHLKERHRYHMQILKEAYEHAMARQVIRRFMLKVARRRLFYKQWQKATVLQRWYSRVSRA